jgi:hypothetical protein
MGPRTTAQLALLFIGLVVWGYGLRANDTRLTWVGIGCFAIATALRFAKRLGRREPPNDEGPPAE